MPTHDVWTRFLREWVKLTPHQQTLFRAAVEEMIEDLRAHTPFRPSPRVKSVKGYSGVFEMTWAPDGRPLSTTVLLSAQERRILSGDASVGTIS
jgi:hypothetical protein